MDFHFRSLTPMSSPSVSLCKREMKGENQLRERKKKTFSIFRLTFRQNSYVQTKIIQVKKNLFYKSEGC